MIGASWRDKVICLLATRFWLVFNLQLQNAVDFAALEFARCEADANEGLGHRCRVLLWQVRRIDPVGSDLALSIYPERQHELAWGGQKASLRQIQMDVLDWPRRTGQLLGQIVAPGVCLGCRRGRLMGARRGCMGSLV